MTVSYEYKQHKLIQREKEREIEITQTILIDFELWFYYAD